MPDGAESEVNSLLDVVVGGNPYWKWTGTHWRLVELADLATDGVRVPRGRVRMMVEAELDWLLDASHTDHVRTIDERSRVHASQEGNGLYALSILGWAADERSAALADRVMSWQWPDGGWNCDQRPGVTRSSFHESVTPALGLVAYGNATGDIRAIIAARRTAELFLQSRVVFSRRDPQQVVHPSWAIPHYPAYWHYDVLQGLRLLTELDILHDRRASDAIDILAGARRPAGFRGRTWASRRQPSAIVRGTSPSNRMLNHLATKILQRSQHPPSHRSNTDGEALAGTTVTPASQPADGGQQ